MEEKAQLGAAYVPQGLAYLPQGPAYLPQGPAYLPQGPPQGGVYPSQGGAYPYPPPYYPQATPQQQTDSTVFVQPQPIVSTAVFTPVGDYYYTASIIFSFICFFCGSWWSLCCTIPAIFVASSVSPTHNCTHFREFIAWVHGT
ncbi:hypothetical protein EMCRGX_G010494 [Ephydatia muelleri]